MKLHAQNQLYTSFSFRDLKVLIASQGMPDSTYVKLHHQFVALIDMYLHAKKLTLYIQQFLRYLTLKILQSDWPRAYLHLTREPDFSQTCGFNRIIKVIMVHDLNPNNLHISELFFLQDPKNTILGRFLGIIPKTRFVPKIQLTQFFTLKAP